MKKLLTKIKSYNFDTYMLILTVFYAMGSLLINLMAIKTLGYYEIIDFEQGLFGNAILPITTAGTTISWLVFACMDINTEVNGKKSSIQKFWTVGIINLILTIIAALVVLIPGNPWTSDSYSGVFAGNWGITLASMLAFFLGNYVNVFIMHTLKNKTKNKTSGIGFSIRVCISTLLGQFLDNSLFYIIALAPGFGLGGLINESVRCATWGNLWTIVGFTTLFELGVELIFSPLFHKISQFLIKKRAEDYRD